MANSEEIRRTLNALTNLKLHSNQSQRPLPPYPGESRPPKLPTTKLPKVHGPSEAERKVELLTRQLEKEFEDKEKKEYYGDCVACSKEVIGDSKACMAMEKLYHSECFVCFSCGRSLREKAFYNVNGRIYCEEDYLVSPLHCSKSSFFVQKFNFDFTRKLSIFLGEKLVKMLWVWTF